MEANRRAAVSAGVLFIAARMNADALLELLAASACSGIAIAVYPVLKNKSPALALGSVAFRTMEALMYGVAEASLRTRDPAQSRALVA